MVAGCRLFLANCVRELKYVQCFIVSTITIDLLEKTLFVNEALTE